VRVEVHPDAGAEANEAYNWYKESAPTLAEDFFSEVFRIIELTAKQPRMWRAWPEVPAKYQARRALLDRFPFAIAYAVEHDVIRIVAVAHLRRKSKYWLVRLRSVK